MSKPFLHRLAALFFFSLATAALAQVPVFPGACPPDAPPIAQPNDNTPRFEFPAIAPTPNFPGMDVGITVWRIPCGQSGRYGLWLRMADGGYLPGALRPKVRIFQNGYELGWIGTEVKKTPSGLQYFYGTGFQWVSNFFNLGSIRGKSETAALIAMTQFLEPDKPITLVVRDTLDWPENVPDLVYEIPGVNPSTSTVAVPEGISGHWWNPDSPGWGVLIDRNADGIVFSAVLTYDENGQSTWFPMTRGEINARGEVVGDAFTLHGTPFAPTANASPFSYQVSGRFALSFDSATQGKIHWTVDGRTTLSPLQKLEVRGTDGSVCRGTESIHSVDDLQGWAVHFQGSASGPGCATLAVLLTYDEAGKPVWYVASLSPQATQGADAAGFPVMGQVYRPRGTPYGMAYEPGQFRLGLPIGTWQSRVVDSINLIKKVEIRIGDAERTLSVRPFIF